MESVLDDRLRGEHQPRRRCPSAALFEAVAEVEFQTGLDFNFIGNTTLTGTTAPAGAEVIMSFTDQQLGGSNSVLGVAGGSYFPGNEVISGHLRVKSNLAVGNTLRAVLLHELGHLVGLDHVDDNTQLMYPFVGSLFDYQNGDREGLWWVGAQQPCFGGAGGGASVDGEPQPLPVRSSERSRRSRPLMIEAGGRCAPARRPRTLRSGRGAILTRILGPSVSASGRR